MLTYLAMIGLCLVFLELLVRMAVVRDAMIVVTTSREATRVMASDNMGDDAKEKFVRGAALSIFKATLRVAAKFVAILLVLYALFRVVAALSPATGQELLAALTAPVPLVAVTLATVAYAWVRGRVVGHH